jgi:trigger factor
MPSTLKKLAPTQVELEIPLPPDEIEAAERRAFARLSRNVKLPGFRPGKVPRRLFEETYGSGVIESEALDDLAPVAYARAVQEHEIEPLGDPEFAILPKEDDRAVRLKATVEVRPEFELGEYKGVAVHVPTESVTDDDVQQSLETLQRERATLVPVDRPVRLGDVVTIDYAARLNDEVLEGTTANGQQTELLEERFIPGFAANIAGMSAGETKEFSLTFPTDYAQEQYAGKAVAFTVELHEVKQIELPALDDDFAKMASDCETLDTLKTEFRHRLEAVAAARRRRAIGNAVMEVLLTRTEIPVPDGVLDREVESMLAEITQDAKRASFDSLEQYVERAGETMEGLHERYRQEATQRIKGTLLLSAIAKAEHIEASSEEVREEISSMARRYGQPEDRMRKALAGRIDTIRRSIVRSKTLDLLIDAAKVVEETR